MNESLKRLESKRKSLYKKLEEIGDFRRGTISVNYRKCGKKNCICTKPGHPGHGPQYLWNTTVKGKSYAKNLKMVILKRIKIECGIMSSEDKVYL